MLRHATVAAALAACFLAGCGKDQSLRCEATERYSTAGSSPPVQIPDDLSPPDESQALRLPPTAAGDSRAPTQPCLESPPTFSNEGRPGRVESAEEPDDDAPAEPEPPPGGDREITE
jgi:hypothetical protein